MERVTINSGGKWILPKQKYVNGSDRLAEYENTGLTPEQIYDMDRLFKEKCEEFTSLRVAHDRQKARLLRYLDWIDGQIIDDPVAEIKEKVEELL